MLTLHIEANSIPELMGKAGTFFGMDFGTAKGPAIVVTDAPEEVKPEPKKAGRPAKAKMEETIAANTAAALPAQPTPAAVVSDPFAAEAPGTPAARQVTFDDVKSALQKVAAKYPGEPGKESPGMEKVRVILSTFNTFKVSALKPEQYAGVLAAAEQA